MEWKIGKKHKFLGEVVGAGIREGEAYRFFKDEQGVISLIPLDCLEEEDKK